LLAPGSSLGGARPKANLADPQGRLWIAKFPSRNDGADKAAWEFVAHQLAGRAGIPMAESRIERVAGPHHTFFTRRFDRGPGGRVHFASAMTMTGHTEDDLRHGRASYLELAEFIQYHGARPRADLHQLWRRIVFNLAISNTDDHLRNHGFLLGPGGWALSPAYDLNPSTDKGGLALCLDHHDNSLDLGLARQVGAYFQLDRPAMDAIVAEVLAAVKGWRGLAAQAGITRAEQELMAGAFMAG
jgi:serine/threonine-protein kinase HipA